MADQNDKRIAPPYVSFTTFKNRVRGLGGSDGEVPHVIDQSLFQTDSGATQAQLMSAFRFLGLIEAQGQPSDRLKTLATADANGWKATLREIVEAKYGEQLPSLAKGSPKSLRDAFADYELQGSVLDKVVRFLIAAASDAELPIGAATPKVGGSGRPRLDRPRGLGVSRSAMGAALALVELSQTRPLTQSTSQSTCPVSQRARSQFQRASRPQT
ncbi:MAG: hypothetical protein ACF8R7_16710 [Phycisphaerales bacterium JB039]